MLKSFLSTYESASYVKPSFVQLSYILVQRANQQDIHLHSKHHTA